MLLIQTAVDGLMLTRDHMGYIKHSVYNIMLITDYSGCTEQNVFSINIVSIKVTPQTTQIFQHFYSIMPMDVVCFYSQVYDT